jgi:small conductance mechanosensitive channel
LIDWTQYGEYANRFLGAGLKIMGLVLMAWIASRLIHRYVPKVRMRLVKVMHARRQEPDLELEKRAATLGGIFRKTVVVAIWVVVFMMALEEAGFNVGPLLAGAGVAGLAVGFGAQNLVRDVISGLFLLMENQIRVNDVAVINGTGGLVEEINLRTTVLRSLDGTVHIFPNGAINTLSNMTQEYSYYVFNIGVAYKEDTDHVSAVVKELADEMMQEETYRSFILAPLQVMGVDEFADSAVMIKARIKTAPIKQWMVGREMNRRIKKKFDELGIEIPFPHRSLYFGEASKAFATWSAGADSHEIKAMISEVLEEKGLESTGAEPQARRKVEPPAPRPEVRRPPAKPPGDRRPSRPAPLGESTGDSESFE